MKKNIMIIVQPLCTKAKFSVEPFSTGQNWKIPQAVPISIHTWLTSQTRAICFFNLICSATSLTILSKWHTEYQTEKRGLMSHTRTLAISMKGGPMMDQMKAAPLTVFPSLLLISFSPSHPPSAHPSGMSSVWAGRQKRQGTGPHPSLSFPCRDKWLSLRPLAEGLALLTNGPGWFSICYVFSRKIMSWITVFYTKILIYASLLPTVIFGWCS